MSLITKSKPFMLLYVNDFLSDSRVLAMDDEQFAWYMRMLMQAWKAKGLPRLPNEDEELMDAAGCKDPEKWREKKKKVLKCWIVSEDGKVLTNKRLTEEFDKMCAVSEVKRKAAYAMHVQRGAMHNSATHTHTDTNTKPKPSPKAAPSGDSRFAPVKAYVEKCCNYAKVPFTWDGSEATHLSKWLKANPDIPEQGVIELVKARFRASPKPGERPRKWIGDLGQYAGNHGTLKMKCSREEHKNCGTTPTGDCWLCYKEGVTA